MKRRVFIRLSCISLAGCLNIYSRSRTKAEVMTVNGLIDINTLGNVLPHEHILVDFVGAEKTSNRWSHEVVMKKILPFLAEVKQHGIDTLIDCTPNYLGRDASLLKKISARSGLHILTNTGYYGGSDHKFLPAHAFTETAEELSSRWISEWASGLDGTEIKPGFIKISVNPGSLSDISRKLIKAAALTHLQTGLTIASHTGPAIAALEQIKILKQHGIDPNAFIWVHAQNEEKWSNFLKARDENAWVSLDGVSDENYGRYADMLSYLKTENALDHVLLSHDAGWYDPEKPDGGKVRGYTTIMTKLFPLLDKMGFKQSEIQLLMKENTKNAFQIAVRTLK